MWTTKMFAASGMFCERVWSQGCFSVLTPKIYYRGVFGLAQGNDIYHWSLISTLYLLAYENERLWDPLVRDVRARWLVFLWFCLSLNSLKMNSVSGREKHHVLKKALRYCETDQTGLIINGANWRKKTTSDTLKQQPHRPHGLLSPHTLRSLLE